MTWQSKLLYWYKRNRRDLPWRRTRDPYKIWVSEVMLQQTTVETVIPYYERFLGRFPTADALAQSSEEEVLGLWSGLGYYARARNLHRAAKIIVRSGGARKGLTFSKRRAPADTVKELQKLPGIGRYTAGAIASIAFGQRVPVLDGNVIRVLSRLFAIKKDPKSTEGQNFFWKKAGEILPKENCGDFNQSLMELGATVCLPLEPLCLLCPVSAFCRARKESRPESYPKGRKKINYQNIQVAAAVIEQGDKILLVQRSGRGLLRGMWELPMVEGDVRALTRRWPVQVQGSLGIVRHSVLNRRLFIKSFVCRLKEPLPPNTAHRWIPPAAITEIPTSSMNRKILNHYK